eukprot:gnl/TRDRNA2_/TRDRNA2_67997_c0_seq1.p1 gnl/TRDRNA2_/TRDRNA2_67997_c0~~gnl/TRDRNA2_/TRDRNA2_67997_c0_seq1.p1  ORF type:complete len:284 (+),score=65.15 gnl/TRDRNA2_/TRDRNA2_67997_c0_seq1:92-943(+)
MVVGYQMVEARRHGSLESISDSLGASVGESDGAAAASAVLGRSAGRSPGSVQRASPEIVAEGAALQHWGPLDGPLPLGGRSSLGTSGRGTSGDVEVLRQKLSSVRRSIATRDQELEALRVSGGRPYPDDDDAVAAALQDVQQAAAHRAALEAEAVERGEELRCLEEELRKAERQAADLEEKNAQHPMLLCCSTSLVWTEEAASDSVWRECIQGLEAENRRKASVALELHGRVHELEEQLRSQLQVNDSRVRSLHELLSDVWDRIKDLPTKEALPTSHVSSWRT